ncbi:DUF58 domain-containing protein [Mariniblastus fucicola]|uniref:DUF58 domain-containing protein n=1 Tax=Mariniblastus fucicola TaxID=980251 RepID=A0A5B9PD67_9BACT|nr:DUF58 domain-containing protein [Mariniblastus fucicola]QEG23135.1 hypothetical protein MFFC18_30300 [Mariniblastus fucicola]
MPDSKRYLHLEAIKRISRLDLRAKHVVEGFLSGMHRSPFFGQSIEFRQHREYAPGDDLRHVDWKVWARQDRLTIKQYEEDTNMRVNLLVDVSNSMKYGRGVFNKFDYAATLATSLAWLVLKQQDAVGCMTFDESVCSRTPTSSKKMQLNKIVQTLESASPKRKTDLSSIFSDAAETFPRRGIMIVISDLFGDVQSTLKGLRLLRQRGHDVLVLHVLDEDELEFPFSGSSRFSDLESDTKLNCNPKALRDGYLEAINEFLAEVRRGCARASIDYAMVRTTDPMDAALAQFLSRRMARK